MEEVRQPTAWSGRLKSLLKGPFETPWVFFWLTVFFLVSANYFFSLYGLVHWRIIAASRMAHGDVSKVFNDMLKDRMNNNTIEAFREKCKEKYWEDDMEGFSVYTKAVDDRPLDYKFSGEEPLRDILSICAFLHRDEQSKNASFRLLDLMRIYRLYGLLSFLSSMVCLVISLKRKRLWIGIVALLLGVYGFITASSIT